MHDPDRAQARAERAVVKMTDAKSMSGRLKPDMAESTPVQGSAGRFVPSVRLILIAASVLRLVAAVGVDFLARRRGSICLFGDTPIYWQYGRAIAEGADYVVHQWDVPHFALRTPGYPLWLAANMTVFGESPLAVRIAQALLGVGMVWWVYRLGRAVGCSEASARWSAALVAIDPFQVGLCALILSESLFTPILVFFMLRLANALRTLGKPSVTIGEHADFVALGALQAFLGLVRPSWLAYLPVGLVFLTAKATRSYGVRKAVLVLAAVMFGWGIVSAPWAARNMQRTGKPAVSGTWGGATLYDSVRPGATGASEMSFVADPQFRDLGEIEQDALWKRLSIEAMRAEPGRILRLAIEKQKRFWSPWPNDSAKLPLVGKLVSAAIVLPVWIAILGGWLRNRRKFWPYLVLSPLVVTAMTHLIFVGSSRYRMAVIVPAMILAGEGFEWLTAVSRRVRAADSRQNQEVEG